MMKKLILILVAFVGLHSYSLASCPKPQTPKDSLAYALGFDVGRGLVERIDSTLNTAVFYDGIVAAFALDTSFMNGQVAQDFIQTYMTVTKPTIDGECNDSLSKEYLAKVELEPGVQKSPSGLLYKIESVGSGEKPAVDDSLFVDFTLYDANGKELQSSADLGGRPIEFINNESAMIAGFLEGVRMLAPGGKATIYVPSELGYGAGGPAPRMALKFEIELVKIVKVADFAVSEYQEDYDQENYDQDRPAAKTKNKAKRRDKRR